MHAQENVRKIEESPERVARSKHARFLTSLNIPAAKPSFDDYLNAPDHGLRKRTSRAGRRAALGQAANVCLGFASIAILGRLLTPEDFGLVGMVAVMIAVLGLFSEGGLSTSTIQRRHISQAQVSNLFWLNVAAGITIAILSAAISPALAWWYQRPEVAWICLALSANYAISGAGVQHGALLRRRLELGRLNATTTVSGAVGLAVGGVAAAYGMSYWAIVIQALVANSLRVTLLWSMCPWRPSAPSRRSGVRPMINFGGALTGSSVLTYLYRKADDMLIGWYWGPAALGLYTRAYALLMQPLQQVAWPIGSVVLPALSRVQHEPERLRRGYRDAVLAVSSISLPLAACMLVCARPLVLTFLGPSWEGSIDIYLALGPAALLSSVTSAATGLAYTALGRGKEALRWSVLAVPLTISCFMIALPHGPVAVAISLSACQSALCLPQIWLALRGTPLRIAIIADAVAYPLAATAIASAVTWQLLRLLPSTQPIPMTLVEGCLAFAVTYSASWRLLPGGWNRLAVVRQAVFR